jgi:hypothetical protein
MRFLSYTDSPMDFVKGNPNSRLKVIRIAVNHLPSAKGQSSNMVRVFGQTAC